MMPERHPRFPLAFMILLLALATALAGGCGFQPRGHTTSLAKLPNPIQIRGLATYNDLYRELHRQLSAAGVRVVSPGSEKTTVLRISNTVRDRRLLSVNSRNRAVEYELIEAATFRLLSAGGEQIVEPQRLSSLRIQYRPEIAVLGSDREAQLLRQDMREELAGRIIQRLAVQHSQ